MCLKRDVRKMEVGIRGAGVWKYCSLAEFGRGHTMIMRSSRPRI